MLLLIWTGVLVQALDAAMPFDFEAKAKRVLDQQRHLRIGVIGFGTFGQFLAKRLVEAGHQVKDKHLCASCLSLLSGPKLLWCLSAVCDEEWTLVFAALLHCHVLPAQSH